MTPDEREQMHILCERLAKEKERDKVLHWVQQLNDLLRQKERRLVGSEVNPERWHHNSPR
jgi:hypothetical protein